MSENAYTSIKWGLWVQPDGPNTRSYYLGCHDLGDASAPKGGTGLIRCRKADGSGYDILASTKDPPEAITFDVNTTIQATADWLERLDCAVNFYVTGSMCGRLDLFFNWERAFAFEHVENTDEGLTGLARREEDVVSEQSFSYEAWPPIHRFYTFRVARQGTDETDALNDVTFCNVEKCADACGSAEPLCESGVAVGDAAAASPSSTADVIYTLDEGEAWDWTAADPFAGGEDIISVECFYVDSDTIRWLVAREADAAAGMEVAYSDDHGATWTVVQVDNVINVGANREGALHALNMNHIWLVLDAGYIYFSEDGGVTWTQQGAGTTAADLNEVWAADENNIMAVGDGDVVVFSGDGGSSWTVMTATGGGNDLVCCNWSFGFWWVGDTGDQLWFSDDDGAAWTERVIPAISGSGGEMTDVEFATALCGFLIHNTSDPIGRFYWTWDGGYTWKALPNVTNAGLNSVHVCDCNLAYAVGEPSGGTAVILKAYAT